MPQATVARPRTHAPAALLLLLLATMAAYYPAADAGFIALDDAAYIRDNPHLRNGLSMEAIRWALTDMESYDYWHPLSWLTHMVDFSLYDDNAGGHHLTNLLFHLANVVLLYLAIAAMTGREWVGLGVAALFALHPMHVESVAWIAERKDVLAGFGWFLAMVAYAWYVRNPGILRYVLVLLAYALGLMAKPMAVTLPCILLVMDAWPLGRTRLGAGAHTRDRVTRWATLAVEKVPLLLLGVASVFVTCASRALQGALPALQATSPGLRLSNAAVSYAMYLAKLLYPVDLAVFYPLPSRIPVSQTIAALGLLAVVTAYALRAAPRYPVGLAGWLWYLGTLVPVIGLVQTGRQAMADRFVYMPAVGLYLPLAWGLAAIAARSALSRRVAGTAAALLLFTLGVLTNLQVRRWKDTETLFTHALRVTSGNHVIHNNLGTVLMAQGRSAEGLAHFAEAVRIAPEYPEQNLNYGTGLTLIGRHEEALRYLGSAQKSNHRPARTNLSLARALHGLSRDSAAAAALRAAVRAEPDSWEVHAEAAFQYRALGRRDDAVRHCLEAVRLNPAAWEPLNELGSIYLEEGNPSEALHCLVKALALRPPAAAPYVNAGIALGQLGRHGEAYELFGTALSLEPESCSALCNRQTALHELGRIDEALAAHAKALACGCACDKQEHRSAVANATAAAP